MTDEEYEELKKEVKIIGKKMDITAMMLSVKGQEYLTAEQYKVLSEKMLAMGIDVNIEGINLNTTISDLLLFSTTTMSTSTITILLT